MMRVPEIEQPTLEPAASRFIADVRSFQDEYDKEVAPVIASYNAKVAEVRKLKEEAEQFYRDGIGRANRRAADRVKQACAIRSEKAEHQADLIKRESGRICQQTMFTINGKPYVIDFANQADNARSHMLSQERQRLEREAWEQVYQARSSLAPGLWHGATVYSDANAITFR